MRSNVVIAKGWLACCLVAAGAARSSGAEVTFIRGDVDETGAVSVTDAVHILYHVFARDLPFTLPVRCEDSADSNDDGSVGVTDALHLLNGLFLGGPPPSAPFPECGADPTEDGIGCERSELCFPTFGGVPLAADGLFFAVDKSSSMMDAGELQIAKREIVRTLARLSGGSEFGLVFFESSIDKFPPTGSPAVASPETVAEAVEFVISIAGGGGSCVQQGLTSAIEMAKLSRGPRKVLFYVGDGGGTCQGANEQTYLGNTLEAVAALNQGEVTIHAIGLLEPAPLNEGFLQDLASQNGGTYAKVAR